MSDDSYDLSTLDFLSQVSHEQHRNHNDVSESKEALEEAELSVIESRQQTATVNRYQWLNFSRGDKAMFRDKCIECHVPLTVKINGHHVSQGMDLYARRNGQKHKQKHKNADMISVRQNRIHLCSVCTVMVYGLMTSINLSELLDTDFLTRELAAKYDVWTMNYANGSSFSHTKAYTCYKCCESKMYHNPFKWCFKCLYQTFPIIADKYSACMALQTDRVRSLLQCPEVRDYLIKRQQIHAERHDLIKSVHQFANVGDCQMNQPEQATCEPDESDHKALASWTSTRVEAVINESEIIKDVAQMIVAFDGQTIGCDSDGRATGKR
jgi:hypothetical protein